MQVGIHVEYWFVYWLWMLGGLFEVMVMVSVQKLHGNKSFVD